MSFTSRRVLRPHCLVSVSAIALLLGHPFGTEAQPTRDPEVKNGIFVRAVRTYDDASLDQLRSVAATNLQTLNPFALGPTNIGTISGATLNQSNLALSAGGATPPAPTAPSLPTPSLSSADFLNEELRLSLQVMNLELLLKGSLNDQSEQGNRNDRKTRTTLGFPIYIAVPPGFKYENAVAEVEASVCSPRDSGSSPANLSILLPQEKTYNVARLMSKSASIGATATVAGGFSLGGSFLHGQQSYFIVKDQDTLAIELPPGSATCENGQPPVRFAWQFRPVLGEKVVRDGLRQSFAQISFPTSALPSANDTCYLLITLRTGWRRYDTKTGRVGGRIDPPRVDALAANTFNRAPMPDTVQVTDNGDGSVTGIVKGAFKVPTSVRVGNNVYAASPSNPSGPVVQSSPATLTGTGASLGPPNPANPGSGLEQNDHFIRFSAPALALALNDAILVNQDGREGLAVIPRPGSATTCPAPGRDRLTIDRMEDSKGIFSTLSWLLHAGKPADAHPPIRVKITAPRGINLVTEGIDLSPKAKIANVRQIKANELELDLVVPAPGDYTVSVPTEAGVPLTGKYRFTPEASTQPTPPVTLTLPPVYPGQTTTARIDWPSPTQASEIVFPCSGPSNDVCQTAREEDIRTSGTTQYITIAVSPSARPGTVLPFEARDENRSVLGAGSLPVVAQLTLSNSEGYPGEYLTTELRGFISPIPDAAAVTFQCPTPARVCGSMLYGVSTVTKDKLGLRVTFTVPGDAQPGSWRMNVSSGDTPLGIGSFKVNPVTVRPFDDKNSIVTVLLGPGHERDPYAPDVIVIGNKAYGLSDAPYFARTDTYVSVKVTNDTISANPWVIWRRLMTADPLVPYRIPPYPRSAEGFPAFSASITALASSGSSAAGASKSSYTPVVVETAVKPLYPNEPSSIKGVGLLIVGDGTPSILSVIPPALLAAELKNKPITITGAFTHFRQGKTTLSITDSKGTITPVTPVNVMDENHLQANLPDGTAPGTYTLSVASGPETLTTQFTVSQADNLITDVSPADANSPVTTLKITGDKGATFDQRSKVRFSNGIFVYDVKPGDHPNELIATVDIAPRASGPTDVTVTTGPRSAAGTAVYRVNPNIPILTQVSPAGIKASDPTPIAVTKDGTAPFADQPTLKFDASEITATAIAASGNQLTAVVTPSSAVQPAANYFAISGSGLAHLRFIHPRIEPSFVSDTLVTFALTDAQVSQIKNLELEYAPGRFYTLALPSASPAPPPPATSLTAMTTGIPAAQTKPLTIKGTGMSQIIAVRFNDQPLAFNFVSDSEISLQLIQNTKSILSAPGVVVVFEYSDKSLKPYQIIVTAAK